ncbi:MAG: hypothetical protein L0387_43995 [Acidobacteria bacterium]|nr:hypothetical protein [Acidobacteriota bacterium]MCI0717674.1 hypothetical protein [Acidobacteriota bacterium]
MAKKWYELFVSVEPASQSAASGEGNTEAVSSAEGTPSAAQTVAEIASSIAAEPTFDGSAQGPVSFEEIYQAADISAPSHGYTITKIAEMLQSEHIRNLPSEVKRSSILLALEAAGVKLKEVIEDAVRRDRALDTYERVLQKAVEELEAAKKEETRQIESELERIMAEHRTRLQANNDALAREKERFFSWRMQKQQEEKKIADAVAHFVSENPISVGGSAASAPAKLAGGQNAGVKE